MNASGKQSSTRVCGQAGASQRQNWDQRAWPQSPALASSGLWRAPRGEGALGCAPRNKTISEHQHTAAGGAPRDPNIPLRGRCRLPQPHDEAPPAPRLAPCPLTCTAPPSAAATSPMAMLSVCASTAAPRPRARPTHARCSVAATNSSTCQQMGERLGREEGGKEMP